MGGSRLIAHCSLLIAHCSPLMSHCSLHPLSGEAKPQPPKFLDVTLKFLDVIVVKREGKYKNIGSFTSKDRIFYLKTSDLFMQKVKENKFYLKLCEYLLKLFQHLPLYQTKESPAQLRARDKTCFYE